jgi:hypothetical protein
MFLYFLALSFVNSGKYVDWVGWDKQIYLKLTIFLLFEKSVVWVLFINDKCEFILEVCLERLWRQVTANFFGPFLWANPIQKLAKRCSCLHLSVSTKPLLLTATRPHFWLSIAN